MRLAKPLVLASRSPRRIHLLRQVGFQPEVQSCDIPEDFDPRLSPAENARELALRKAECVAGRLERAYVVGADTIVAINGQMLGKPADAEEAKRMLQLLSGRTHTVYTGFAIVDRPSNLNAVEVESTLVTFRDLYPDEVDEYVQGGSPMDKAGAYGIQDDYGAVFVSRVEGCFYNVVGFPLARFFLTLKSFQEQVNSVHV